MAVEILSRTRSGEYFIYRAAVDGRSLSDTVSIPAAYVLDRSDADAKAFVEKQIRNVARLLDQQARGEVETFR